MATFLTAAVEEGTSSFPQFVWTAASAFFSHFDLPETLESKFNEAYHLDKIKDTEEELKMLRGMTRAALVRKLEELNSNAKKSNEGALKQTEAIVARFDARILEVEAWEPPIPEHQSLKDYMLKELKEGRDIKAQMVETYKRWLAEADEETPESFLARELSYNEQRLIRLKEELEKGREQAAKTTHWLQELNRSVPRPPKRK